MSISTKYVSAFIYNDDHEVQFIDQATSSVYLFENSSYKIALFNHDRKLRVDARISIDSKTIGTFRIPANGKIVIERPTNEARKFTATRFLPFDLNTGERIANPENYGLIEIEAIRESPRREIVYGVVECDGIRDSICPVRSEGGTEGGTAARTMLGEKSKQVYVPAEDIEADPESRVTLRIYVKIRERFADITPL